MVNKCKPDIFSD